MLWLTHLPLTSEVGGSNPGQDPMWENCWLHSTALGTTDHDIIYMLLAISKPLSVLKRPCLIPLQGLEMAWPFRNGQIIDLAISNWPTIPLGCFDNSPV